MIQVVKEEKIAYRSFVNMVCTMLKDRLGEGYDLKIHKVTKNNSLELDSLVVLKKGVTYAPNIYLLSYYESYLQGTPVTDIVDRLYYLYISNTKPSISIDYSMSVMPWRTDQGKGLVDFLVHYRLGCSNCPAHGNKMRLC